MTTDIASYHLFNGSSGSSAPTEQGLPPIRSILQEVSFNDQQHQHQLSHQSSISQHNYSHQQPPSQPPPPQPNIAMKLPALIPSASIKPIVDLQQQRTVSPPLIKNSITPPLVQQIPASELNEKVYTTNPAHHHNLHHANHHDTYSHVTKEIIVHQQQAQQYDDEKIIRPKKKYECPLCFKNFTTSGHLARHTRIHTGERNHMCPFEGCGAKFSRQDNCMQHYRTHLSKGSRKKNSRTSKKKL